MILIILADACSSNPCGTGGTCSLDSNSQAVCTCKQNYYGNNCQYQVTSDVCSKPDTDAKLCSQWASSYCSFNYKYNDVPVPIYCPVSCNLCTSCQDTQPSCTTWASLGLCSVVNAKDPNLCRKSCGLC